MSMNMIVLGVALWISIAAGMAFTITLVVLILMYIKKATIRALSTRPRSARRVTSAVELVAVMMVALLGGLMLYGTSRLS